jgi:excisionase family DNA binding protein
VAMITTTEAAGILAVSPRTIRSLIKTGALPAVRIASEFRIDQDELNRFIESNRVKNET